MINTWDDLDGEGDAGAEFDMLVAHYLLKMESSHKLPKVAINDIVEGTVQIVSKALSLCEDTNPKISSSIISKFRSDHLRYKFYKEKCGFIEPKEIPNFIPPW
jgi:hypothetical protein